MGQVRNKQLFAETIIDKILEANSRFHVKELTTGKVQFLFFRRFLQLLAIFSFRDYGRALGFNYMKF